MFNLCLDTQSDSNFSDNTVQDSLSYKIDNVKFAEVDSFLNIGFPDINNMLFLFSLKQFNAFYILVAALKQFGCIDEVFLSSYNISRKIAYNFADLLVNKKIKSVNLYCSDSSKSMFQKSYEALNEFSAQYENYKVHFVWNHSKICLFQINDNYFVCEGSGNFSSNARYEQYLLINNKQIYEFRKTNITSMAR